jgi:hypothetical protein
MKKYGEKFDLSQRKKKEKTKEKTKEKIKKTTEKILSTKTAKKKKK